jgi:hypothetical protein
MRSVYWPRAGSHASDRNCVSADSDPARCVCFNASVPASSGLADRAGPAKSRLKVSYAAVSQVLASGWASSVVGAIAVVVCVVLAQWMAQTSRSTDGRQTMAKKG